MHIYLFLPPCSLPEKLVSYDSAALKLSQAPPSMSLGVIAAPHGGAVLGDRAEQCCAIASDKQLAFTKKNKFPPHSSYSPTLARFPVAVMNTNNSFPQFVTASACVTLTDSL